MNLDRQALIQAITKIARDAGAKILTIYQQDFDVKTKSDASPVTEADVERPRKLFLQG